MPLNSNGVGLRLKPWTGFLDARWLMAYAAGIGRDDEVYLDTTRDDGVIAHPVFPVAPEWAQLTDRDSGMDLGLTAEEAQRGVHASHDVVLHRPIRQDVHVTVEAEVTGIASTRAGALITMRFDGVESGGAPLWTTWMQSMYRGVATSGPDRPDPAMPPAPAGPAEGAPAASVEVPLSPVAGQVYNECARLWNPIHSDRAVALAAGLPRPILHGSATFAHGVNAALDRIGAGPESVLRLGASFRAMVEFPGHLTVDVFDGQADGAGQVVRFQVRNTVGALAVRDAFLIVR